MTQTKQEELELIILSDEDDQPPEPTNPWMAVIKLMAATVETPTGCRCGNKLDAHWKCPDLGCEYRRMQ